MQDTPSEAPDYRSLGLIANPFEPVVESSDSIGVRLAVRAAVLRLLSAVDAAASDPDHRPIVVEKSPEIPSYYDVAALSELFTEFSAGSAVPGMLAAYVPLDMMRIGRVRAALSIVAERVSGANPDLIIARWCRRLLSEPDTELPEWKNLVAENDVPSILESIDADEAAFAAEVWGEKVSEREGAEDIDTMLTIAAARQGRLEIDPEEDADSGQQPDGEDAADDPLGEAFVTPLTEDDDEKSAEADSADALLREYVLAYTREHLSPVVARGIEAYRAQGTSSMAQELKITKAPTKTLAAVLTFACSSFRAGVLMYDRFEMWESVPTDLRMKIIATLTQVRWAVKDSSVMVLFVSRGDAPELRESFAAANVVPWAFLEVERVFSDGVAFDREAALSWIASASVGELPAWAEGIIGCVPEGVRIEDGCAALAEELRASAAEGRQPDLDAVGAALAGAERAPAK